MKNKWLGFACLLPLLSGCNDANSSISASSDTVSKQQIDTIITNINKLYPDASNDLKQNALNTAVRAIENLVFIKGGSFEMGDFRAPCEIPSRTTNRIDWSPDAQCLSSPLSTRKGADYLHKVTLDSYSMSAYETSFMDMEWMRQINGLPVAADNMADGSIIKRNSDRYQKVIQYRKNQAARIINWQEAKDYCQWLGNLTVLPFDLPTEAQWEYAARNRGEKRYYATNNGYLQYRNGQYFNPNTGYYIDYTDDEVNAGTSTEDQIGQWSANPLGIYGMSNNISEWTNDWYSPDYYQESPKLNPQGPKTGAEKIMRDGTGAMTFDRVNKPLMRDHYYPNNSFRCSLQQKTPAIILN
ncbi:SUMF1/EgtB/PvdO family nonheme iron enzyme [Aliivibrio sp. S10_S31]|uniref:formylglycine-generating enzyme family protein n=1 Tax=Aliivibrio sp. S10_S31 TaxID=2720224 RepID=UPI0016817B7F|nr:SUMF1/EgtB/PvdO family nonheme iron enzyme [Aliivibrio sp. S10_S31]MBD1569791.1 formylglycine-generating enzyme family protein [Aliivibrio sp. S10_S31]